MSSKLSPGELTAFTNVFEAHLNDTCQILTLSTTLDDLQQPIKGYATGTAIDCGFDPTGGVKNKFSSMYQLEVDAVIRLGLSNVFDETSKLLITERAGIDITPEAFEIMKIERGFSGYVVGGKRWKL